MKNFHTLLLFLGIAFANSLQAQKPFEQYGIKTEVLTFSNGKYDEYFDEDSIVQIGTVMFNTNTNKVVSFVQQDTAYSEATLQPEIISRWLSPDPLAWKFPYSSPYVFTNNNPIIYVDKDGREPNLAQATTTQGFSLFISQKVTGTGINGVITSSDIYKYLLKNSGGTTPRYIYTEKNGWIDMNHVFSVLENGKTATDLLEPASGLAIIREAFLHGKGETSYYSYEDLPSNKFASTLNLSTKDAATGASVQLTGDALLNSLSEQICNAGATEPKSAPNYRQIPATEDRGVVKNFLGNVQELTPEQLKSGNFVPQNHTDKPYNLTNFPAAPSSLQKTETPQTECQE